jgi:hypothetical protein
MMDSVTIGRSPVQKFGADHAGPTIYDDALKRPPRGGRNVMSVIMGLLVVSALAGLVLGFYFELAALAVSGLILSISAAMILQKEDFGFPEGVGIIFVVLTVNQIAYLVGATLASRDDQ